MSFGWLYLPYILEIVGIVVVSFCIVWKSSHTRARNKLLMLTNTQKDHGIRNNVLYNLKNCRSTNVFYDHFRLVTVHGCLFVNKCTKLPCKMRCSYTKRVSLDLQTLFWLMVLVAMTIRKLAKRKTNMFFLWGKLFNKRSAPYPTKMQNPALQKRKQLR